MSDTHCNYLCYAVISVTVEHGAKYCAKVLSLSLFLNILLPSREIFLYSLKVFMIQTSQCKNSFLPTSIINSFEIFNDSIF